MLGALLYLRLTSFKNWLRVRGKNLRQPKQLAGAVMFGLYFWFFFLRPGGAARPLPMPNRAIAEKALASTHVALALPADWLPAATAIGALALLVFATLIWVLPTQPATLGFTEAEIAFLFPAPITRRALIHFRLLSAQFRSLVGATVMMLISNRWSFLGGSPLTHAIGWWFVFSALNLHYGGAGFTLTRLSAAGIGTIGRRTLILAFVAGVIAITVWRLPPAARLPVVDDASLTRPITDWIAGFASAPPLGWLLWPFKLVLGPFLAPDLRVFLLALGPALVVVVLHYRWVVMAAVAFEDAAIDQAQKRSARIAAWRSGQRRFGSAPVKARRGPFSLPGRGRPELAFLWKNLLSTWPYFNLRVLFGCAAVIVGAGIWLRHQPAGHAFVPGLGIGAAFFGVYVLVIGPQFARQDIRSDLGHADILKTFPLPGWQIVLGELLAPAAILTGVLWLALLVVGVALPTLKFAWLTPPLRVVCGGWLALGMPLLVTLQLLVPNAAALIFPGWFQTHRTRGGGPEVAGQRMLFFFAQTLTMVLALLPAGLFGWLLIFILWPFIGPAFAISVAAVVILAVLAGEVWCGIWLLGQRFERLDLSAELRG